MTKVLSSIPLKCSAEKIAIITTNPINLFVNVLKRNAGPSFVKFHQNRRDYIGYTFKNTKIKITGLRIRHQPKNYSPCYHHSVSQKFHVNPRKYKDPGGSPNGKHQVPRMKMNRLNYRCTMIAIDVLIVFESYRVAMERFACPTPIDFQYQTIQKRNRRMFPDLKIIK